MDMRTINKVTKILTKHYGCARSALLMVWMGDHEVAIYSPRRETQPLPRKVVEKLMDVDDMVRVLQYETGVTDREEHYNFTGVLLNLV